MEWIFPYMLILSLVIIVGLELPSLMVWRRGPLRTLCGELWQRLAGRGYIPYDQVVEGFYIAVYKGGRPVAFDLTREVLVEVVGTGPEENLVVWDQGDQQWRKVKDYVFFERVDATMDWKDFEPGVDMKYSPRYNDLL